MTRALLLLTTACTLGLMAACGSRATLGAADASPDAHGADAGKSAIADAARDATADSDAASAIADAAARDADAGHSNEPGCTRAFDVLYGKCGPRPVLPRAELDRLRPGFVHFCEATLALPGDTTGGDQVAACLEAAADAGCSPVPSGPLVLPPGIDSCSRPGMLPADAGCLNSAQCLSQLCLIPEAVPGPDGGSTEPTCGSCARLLAPGDSCASTGVCPPGTACDFDPGGSKTCVPILVVDAGGSCVSTTAQCAPGLECNATAVCVPSVTPPLGATGAPCSNDFACASGLACDTNTQKCGATLWAQPGQPSCAGLVRCPVAAFECAPTCPFVIPEGQPCTPGEPSHVCEVYDSCMDGICSPAKPATCP